MYAQQQGPYQPPAEDVRTPKVRWWALGVITATVVMLSGIGMLLNPGDDPEPAPVATVETERSLTPMGDVYQELGIEAGESRDMLLSDLRNEPWLVREVVPHPVLAEELARDVCQFLDDGLTVGDVVSGIANYRNFPEGSAGFFTAASVYNYCLHHLSAVEEYSYGGGH